MNNKRKIEIFSTGCPDCEETIDLVDKIACQSCEIEVWDIHEDVGARKAEQYGVKRFPSVVIDKKIADCCIADCCAGVGAAESGLRSSGIGTPV